MRLTFQDIKQIDKWLKNHGVKYIDIRYELIDHLVTEYQQIENYPDLESFLQNRLAWCKKIEKKKRSAINLGITTSIFKKLLDLFTNIKSLTILVLIGIFFYYLNQFISHSALRNALFSIYISAVVYQLYLMIFTGFGPRLKKEAISVVYLINSFSLSQLPLYFIGIIPEKVMLNPTFYISYLGIGILLSFSSILVFHQKRKKIINELALLK